MLLQTYHQSRNICTWNFHLHYTVLDGRCLPNLKRCSIASIKNNEMKEVSKIELKAQKRLAKGCSIYSVTIICFSFSCIKICESLHCLSISYIKEGMIFITVISNEHTESITDFMHFCERRKKNVFLNNFLSFHINYSIFFIIKK